MLIHRILLLESDNAAREAAQAQLAKEGFEVHAPHVPDSFPGLTKSRADLVIVSTDYLKGTIEEMLKDSGVLLVSAETPQLGTAIEWVERGAVDYLLKPFDSAQLRAALIKADRHFRCFLGRRAKAGSANVSVCSGAVLHGSSPAVAQLRQSIRNLARTEATVLIQGEPGTGHEHIAANLHGQSNRGSGPCVRVDCAGANATELDTELFGNRVSKLLLAGGGTVVLEEVAQLELPLQEKLLRFCQGGVLDYGGRTVPADVRIVATSSTPLEPRMKAGTFREDLFFRLDMARLDLPPLRERVADIVEIGTLFREYYRLKYDRGALAFSPEAQLALTQHDWPGNLRELEQTIERGVLRCGAEAILRPDHLGLAATTTAPTPQINTLAEVEKQHILAVLERCNGNRTHAAAKLDISIRTLRNKLREFRLAAAA